LLVEVGTRLSRAVRSSDSVFRLGGDEFVVVMHGLTNSSDVVLCAGSLLSSLQLPTCLEHTPATVTGSIGVAAYPESEDISALLANADSALYEAKRLGKNRFHIFKAAETVTNFNRSSPLLEERRLKSRSRSCSIANNVQGAVSSSEQLNTRPS
jgi:predicted signal transduction protein with EAL and GGDEF domain